MVVELHIPQAKGRVERNFGTAQERLVKGMSMDGVKTLEEANPCQWIARSDRFPEARSRHRFWLESPAALV